MDVSEKHCAADTEVGRGTYLVHALAGIGPESGMMLEPAQREVRLENNLVGRVDITSLNEDALLVEYEERLLYIAAWNDCAVLSLCARCLNGP